MKDVYAIDKPKNPLPVIFDSPHSGRTYPADFNHVCPSATLNACEDNYVDQLFSAVPQHNATLLTALFPRTYIDPNRAIDDIDPQLLAQPWQGPASPTARSDAGIGLIRRLAKPGIPLYDRPLTQAEIQARIDNYYTPYHTALGQLITQAHYNYGQVWHINCHSMPGSTATPRRPIGMAGNTSKPVDFCLGDRDATSCDPSFTRAVRDHIKSLGYTVTINDPFKGVELIQQYSAPAQGRHSLQIEINKALYINEITGEKSKNFDRLKADITTIIGFITDHAESMLTPVTAD